MTTHYFQNQILLASLIKYDYPDIPVILRPTLKEKDRSSCPQQLPAILVYADQVEYLEIPYPSLSSN